MRKLTIRKIKKKAPIYLKSRIYTRKESHGNGGNANIAHVTYAFNGNAGDVVLSYCVRKTFEHFSSVNHWDIIRVSKPVTSKVIEKINDCQSVLIGGGGLFLPDTNKNLISGWQWPVSSEQLDAINKPIVVFSVGYNHFPGQIPDNLFIDSLQKILKKSSFFGLRNYGSINAVREIVAEDLRDKIVYQPCTTTLARKLFKDSLPNKKTSGKIAVNMAFDRADRRFGDKKDEILNKTARAIKAIEKKGYEINYVCHCRDDAAFLPYLDNCNVNYKLIDFSFRYPQHMLRYYNDIDLVLGMRGHAQMIPFGLNCNIISLGTHDKMRWFLEDIDAIDWHIDLTETAALTERITNCFENVHEHEFNLTKQRLLDAQDKLWKITEQNIQTISKIGENIL